MRWPEVLARIGRNYVPQCERKLSAIEKKGKQKEDEEATTGTASHSLGAIERLLFVQRGAESTYFQQHYPPH